MQTFSLQIPERYQSVVLKEIIETMKESVLITAPSIDNPEIIYANNNFTTMTGYTLDELIGRSPKMLQGPKTDRVEIERLKKDLQDTHHFNNGHTVNYRKDGSEYIVEWDISPLKDEMGNVIFYISVQRDVSDLFEAKRQIDILNDTIRDYLIQRTDDNVENHL